MKEVRDFLKECGVYYLATMDNDYPRVRPFGTAEIFEDHLYIETGKKKDVFKQIEKNNKVEICACKGDRWVRLSGELVIDDRVEAKKDMLDKNPVLRNLYSEYDENTIVLYFKNAKAVFKSFSGEDRTIEF